MKKFNNLIKNLDLIFWPGGHFGAFFTNLLNASKIKHGDPEFKYFSRFPKTREWSVVDYFSYYYYDQVNTENLKKQLKTLYKDQWEPYFFYICYQYTHRYFGLGQGDLPDRTINQLNEREISLLLGSPVHNINPKLKFTKCHELDYFFLNDDLVWNNKFAVIFPENKQWIANIMLAYKHRQPVKHLIKNLRTGFDYQLLKNKNFKTIDIYNIIFNNNLTTVYAHFPDFQINHREKHLLKLVQADSKKILSLYDLDHELEIDSKADMEKLVEKISQRALTFTC